MVAGLVLALATSVSGCSPAPAPLHPVTGSVRLGPFCPVEREGQPCPTPPQAFDDVRVAASSGADQVRARVSPDGTFRLPLPSGRWSLTSDAGMGCASVLVVVPAPGPVVIDCDTGIR